MSCQILHEEVNGEAPSCPSPAACLDMVCSGQTDHSMRHSSIALGTDLAPGQATRCQHVAHYPERVAWRLCSLAVPRHKMAPCGIARAPDKTGPVRCQTEQAVMQYHPVA